MKIKYKLLLAMGIMALSISTVFLFAFYIAKINVNVITEVEHPKDQALSVLESSSLECKNDVLSYLVFHEENRRELFKTNAEKFNIALHQYSTVRRIKDYIEEEYVKLLKDRFIQFKYCGQSLMKLRDEQFNWLMLFKSLKKSFIKLRLDDLAKEHRKLIYYDLDEIEILLQSYIILPDSSLRNEIKLNFDLLLDKFVKKINEINQNSDNNDRLLNKMLISINKIISIEDGIYNELINFEQLSNELDNCLNSDLKKMIMGRIINAKITIRDICFGVLFTFFIALTVALIYSISISRRLSGPINILVNIADRLSKGQLTDVFPVINSNDEIGRLALSFKNIIRNTRKIENSAKEIGKGNFDANIALRSNDDSLGHALIQMKNNLKELALIKEKETWLITCFANIMRKVQRSSRLDHLSSTVLELLAEMLGAEQGVFYIYDKDVCAYKPVGTYACARKVIDNSSFKQGEGVIGQCGKSKKSKLITNLNEKDVYTKSGLVDIKQANIAIYPIAFEKDIMGVLEISTHKPFNQIQLSLLEMVAENLGIVINNIQNSKETARLLEETKIQTGILEKHKLELSESNDKLAMKTIALQSSKEELKKSNDELKEKTEHLVLQKQEIEQQNQKIIINQSEIQKKAKELMQASRYKTEFLANISHELRTPLNSMLILAKLFAENQEGNLNNEQVKQANVIHRCGNELLALINDILDLSKVEAGKLNINNEIVDVNMLFDELKDSFTPITKKKGLKFDLEISKEVNSKVYTDPIRLKQILKNLISNSIKFTNHGFVKLFAYIPNDFEKKEKTLNPGVNYTAFSVIDSGIGISKDKSKIIFEAFQQADGATHRKFGGTGLGLSISKGLIKLLKGNIRMSSEVGRGSVFTVFLPDCNKDNDITYLQTENILKEPDNQLTSKFFDKKFLIIDSNMRNVYKVSSILQAKNAEVLVADSKDMFEGILKENANLDVVLCSNCKTELNECLEQLFTILKNKKMQIPVIMYCEGKDSEVELDLATVGIEDFIDISLPESEVIEKLKRIL